MKEVDALLDMLAEGAASGDVEWFGVLSNGAPCRCGPGFCASVAGYGFVGCCAGSRQDAAPDCTRCGAPHQSTAGCWNCDIRGKHGEDSLAVCKSTVRAMKLGVTMREMLERQDARWAQGDFVDMDKLLDEVEQAAK